MRTTDAAPLSAETLRSDFPILATRLYGGLPLVYLDNAATTQHPRAVIDTIRRAYESQYANVHRGIHYLSELSTDLYEEAREAVQRLIGAERACEVVFTSGTTASINLVARSWGDAVIGPDDEILLTEMEHHSNLVPWQQLAQRSGCRLRYIPVTADGRLCLDGLDDLLTERTRMVAVAAVSNVLGTVNPLEPIIRRAHQRGARVLVDAAQSVPHLVTDVQALDVDFLVFSGHKMLGPSGVGVLYGKESLLESMPPFLGGGSMIHRVTLEGFEPATLPSKFEAGTPPIVPAIGLKAAIDYLAAAGLEHVHRHEAVLTGQAHQLLEGIDGLRILGPPPAEKGGIVSFVLDGLQASDVAMAMDEQGVAVRAGHHCAMPLHARLGVSASIRASFYLYNTADDVRRLDESLRRALNVLRR